MRRSYQIKKEKGLVRHYNYASKASLKRLRKSRKGRTPWNKGWKNCYSQETLRNMSKTKIEGYRSGRIKPGIHDNKGRKNPMYGKHHTVATRQLQSIKRILYYSNPRNRKMISIIMRNAYARL